MPIKIKKLIDMLVEYDYEFVGQKGSHQKYRNLNNSTIIVPYHKELKIGTARSIVKDFCIQNNISFKEVVKKYNLKF